MCVYECVWLTLYGLSNVYLFIVPLYRHTMEWHFHHRHHFTLFLLLFLLLIIVISRLRLFFFVFHIHSLSFSVLSHFCSLYFPSCTFYPRQMKLIMHTYNGQTWHARARINDRYYPNKFHNKSSEPTRINEHSPGGQWISWYTMCASVCVSVCIMLRFPIFIAIFLGLCNFIFGRYFSLFSIVLFVFSRAFEI